MYEILWYFVLEGSLTFFLHCPVCPPPPAPDDILKIFAMGIAWCYYGIIKPYFLDVGVAFRSKVGCTSLFFPFSPYRYLSRQKNRVFLPCFFQRRESWTSSVSFNYSSFSLGVRITVRSWRLRATGDQTPEPKLQNLSTGCIWISLCHPTRKCVVTFFESFVFCVEGFFFFELLSW